MTNGKTSRENPDYQPEAAGASSYLYVGIGLVVVIALAIGGFLWFNNKSYPPADDKVLAENASFIVGDKAAPITIDIFEDFGCAGCSEFEKDSGAAVRQDVIDGKIRVRYHLLNFLDKSSTSGDYSSRAAGAALCVARDDDREVFWKLQSALFQRWTGEGKDRHLPDLDNRQIADLAVAAGASPATVECIVSGKLVDEARGMADESSKQLSNALEGTVQTPTVLLAGKEVHDIGGGPAWLEKIIAGERPTE